MPEDTEWTFGKHRLTLECPDVLRIQIRGSIKPEEAEECCRLLFDIGDRYGPVYAIADLRDAAYISQKTRAIFSRPERPYPYRSFVMYGAPRPIGAFVKLMVTAGRVLMPSSFLFPATYVSTETEARAYIAEQRAKPLS